MKGNAITEKEHAKMVLLRILYRHIGAGQKIGMGELYREVFGEEWHNRINDTRALRTLITELRHEGVPICSVASNNGGGYYLASAGSELTGYCERLRTQALKKLKLEAKIRRVSLPDLIGQMAMNFGACKEADV